MNDQDRKSGRSLVPFLMAERLRGAMARRRISQRKLADEAGIPQATLATYLSGRVAMPAPALLTIARVIGADPGWLLAGAEHRLDLPALTLAMTKAVARTRALDFSTPAAEKAIAETLSIAWQEYGAACNLVWTGSANPGLPGVVTIDDTSEDKARE